MAVGHGGVCSCAYLWMCMDLVEMEDKWIKWCKSATIWYLLCFSGPPYPLERNNNNKRKKKDKEERNEWITHHTSSITHQHFFASSDLRLTHMFAWTQQWTRHKCLYFCPNHFRELEIASTVHWDGRNVPHSHSEPQPALYTDTARIKSEDTHLNKHSAMFLSVFNIIKSWP